MKYYGVISTFSDFGNVTVTIISTEGELKPDNTYTILKSKDMYYDWFDNYSEAQTFAKEIHNA